MSSLVYSRHIRLLGFIGDRRKVVLGALRAEGTLRFHNFQHLVHSLRAPQVGRLHRARRDARSQIVLHTLVRYEVSNVLLIGITVARVTGELNLPRGSHLYFFLHRCCKIITMTIHMIVSDRVCLLWRGTPGKEYR